MTASTIVENANATIAKSAPVTISVGLLLAVFMLGVEWRDRQAKADLAVALAQHQSQQAREKDEEPPQAVIPPEQMAVLMGVSKSVGSLDSSTGQISKDVEAIRKTQGEQSAKVNEIALSVKTMEMQIMAQQVRMEERSAYLIEKTEAMIEAAKKEMKADTAAMLEEMKADLEEHDRGLRGVGP